MPRRYHRRRRYAISRPVKTTKYSNETFGSQFTITNESGTPGTFASFSFPIIPSAGTVLGTRKAKNFTMRICTLPTIVDTQDADAVSITGRLAFALIYVPEGTEPSPLQFGAGDNALSLYEPNQNVIMAGIVDSQQTYSFKTRLARNLNSGDQIFVVLRDLTAPSTPDETIETRCALTVNYAISF